MAGFLQQGQDAHEKDVRERDCSDIFCFGYIVRTKDWAPVDGQFPFLLRFILSPTWKLTGGFWKITFLLGLTANGLAT